MKVNRRGRLIAPSADLSAIAPTDQESRRGRLIAPIASAQRSEARFNPSASVAEFIFQSPLSADRLYNKAIAEGIA